MTEEQKEKYANFLNKVSEILGLNKPVDILRLCAVTDEYLRPIEKHIAELEAGRPKWHKVADGDLPNCEHGHTVFNQDLDRVIIRNGRFEHLDGCPTKVVAWCEIPKYTEV